MSLLLAGERDRERLWFRAISDHVYETSGIWLHIDNRSIYERKVQAQADALRMPHLRDYYLRLRYHPAAETLTQQLIEAVTTGETYFHRESGQLHAFFDRLWDGLPRPPLPGPRVVWSAACSTGEEPYTLAMLALDRGLTATDIRIVGGDISSAALRRAREGIYRDSAFRTSPPAWRGTYFERSGDGLWRIRDRVRDLVEFTGLNLVREVSMRRLPEPQAIFCRNVLIYFDRAAKTRAVRNLEGRLTPGGLLLLGHAESLLQLPHGFEVEHNEGEVFYRRPREQNA